MKKIFSIALLAMLTSVSTAVQAGETVLKTFNSPDKKNEVVVCQDPDNGTIYLRMNRNGNQIISNSSLGMNTSAGDYTKDLKFDGVTTKTINETYKMYTGKSAYYTNNCEEATVKFSKNGVTLKMDLIVRAYNDGVAYRYYFYNTTLSDGNFRVNSDNSRIVVNTYKRCWGQPWSYDYSKSMGKAFSWADAQKLASDLSDNDGFGQGCFAAPLMIQSTLGDDYYVLISDGAVDQWFCRGVLRAGQTSNVGRFDFLLRGEKNKGVGVNTKCPLYTPWRCAVVGSLATIAQTTMFENVTDATQPDPTGKNWDWVQGGFHTWDWGCTQNTQSLYRNQVDNIDCAKGYIDFNAKVGFKYYTLDEGWRSCTYNGSIDNYVKEVVKYAKSKGQGVWLWQASGSWPNDLAQLKDKFKWFKDMGAVGCKIDFFYDGDTRGVMQKQERIAEAAAANGLMINFHGCPTPTGLRRKWPNVVAYEAVDGNEDYFTGGWNNTGTDPGYNGLLSVMRNAVGPMDYTICEFRTGIDGKGTKRDNTSWAHQLATIVTLECGNQWFSDAWQNVQNEANIMDAIKNAPSTWAESKCLYAWVGDNTVKDIQGNEDANFRVVWARRNGNNWYVGGTTNPAWTYNLDCSFLGDGTYKAVIFKDGANQTTVDKETRTNVTKATKFDVKSLERGGFYIRFERTDGGTVVEPTVPAVDEDTQFYLYNVGAQQWIKTGGLSKNPDSPALAAEAERTANVIVKQGDGTYTIADPEYAPAAWGVQGRNTIYESNNGSVKTNSWGTTLIPGFTFTSTGDADGSVYIEYTWGQWTKGNLDIVDPSNKTYALYYGDWALSTTGWNDTQKAEVENKSVYSDLTANKAAHGAYAKWLIVPVKNGKIDVKQNPDTQFYLYNVGQNKWIKTGGLSKNPDSPALAEQTERTANVIVKQADGTYTIADPEFAPAAWGVQGRNTIYESNDGSVKTNSWGTTLIPGFKFVSTGDNDGSVYIEYTWGQWTKGNVNIADPSNKTYALYYGDWALGTDGWSDAQKADVTAKGVYSDLQANETAHGADAKWLIVPVANGKVDVQPARQPEVVPVNSVSVSLSSLGVATYSSAYPLDFTDSEVGAYITAGFNKTTSGLILTRIYKVPAYTGLILKGEEGNYTVPVQDNKWFVETLLEPAVTATTIYGQENGYVNYVLSTNGSNKIQFYAVDGSTQLAANRAYLHVPASSEAAKARVLNLEFEDEVTGIKNVGRDVNDGDSRFYDLQGRQVRPAHKGLYIQNGKKIVINQ